MGILPIVFIILAIMVVAFILSIMKKLVKIAFYSAIIFIIISLATNYSINKDFSSLKERLSEQPLVVLMHEGKVISAFETGIPLSEGEKETLNDLYYRGQPFEAKKYYIFQSASIKGIPAITINNKAVTGEQLHAFFIKDSPLQGIVYQDLQVKETFAEGTSFKDAVFMYLYKNELRMGKSPLQFFKNFKEGTIEVYPKTLFFEFAELMPIIFIEEKINKLKDSLEEKKEELT